MSENRCAVLRVEIAKREALLRPLHHIHSSKRNHLPLRPPSDVLRSALIETRKRQVEVKRRIVHARQVLVREAMAVFGLNDHEIAKLELPSPDTFRGEL